MKFHLHSDDLRHRNNWAVQFSFAIVTRGKQWSNLVAPVQPLVLFTKNSCNYSYNVYQDKLVSTQRPQEQHDSTKIADKIFYWLVNFKIGDIRFCIFIWTASSEFGTYRLCEQRRFRRACASAQSRQNLRCSLIQAVNQEELSDRKPDPWPL